MLTLARSDLVLASPKVSKNHLRLSRCVRPPRTFGSALIFATAASIRTDSTETLVSLHDLSTNGYALNGIPNRRGALVLNHGDVIELAGTVERTSVSQLQRNSKDECRVVQALPFSSIPIIALSMPKDKKGLQKRSSKIPRSC